ncbi:MAG: hypothetical protein HFE76_11290 [Firmicutes bacterium]|nr:hypothetical protein [Bacillota bacterium]
MSNNLISWQRNGSMRTVYEFYKLDSEMRQEVLKYIKEFQLYEQLTVNGTQYLLVHGALAITCRIKK